MSRLDDTSNCPVADECASCSGTEDLAVVTLDTVVGVYCATLCAMCADEGRLPKPRSAPATARLVAEHCGHVGLDADQAAALRDAEKRGGE